MMKKLVIVILLMLSYISTSYAASFQGIGDLPGGEVSTEVEDVSGDGSVVVGNSEATFGSDRGFKWDWINGITELSGFPVGTRGSNISAVSYDGSVIVGNFSLSSITEAFMWKAGTPNGLGFLPNGSSSRAASLSADGSVIVGTATTSDGKSEAFRWQSGSMIGLGELPGGSVSSSASNVSADGIVIIGGSSSDLGPQAFRHESGIMTPIISILPENDKVWGLASAVSSDGSKIVGALLTDNSIAKPIMWTSPNTFIELGDLPGGSTRGIARDITPDGTLVVGNSTSFNGGEAFIWDEINGMRNLREVLINDYGLDLTGWALWEAVAISDDGLTIVGNGTNPDNHDDGWVAYLGDSIDDPTDNPLPDSIVPTTISSAKIVVKKSVMSFAIKGLYIGSETEINEGSLTVQVGSYQETIDPNNPGIKIKSGKSYSYKGSKGKITSAKFDYKKQTFKITGKGISSATLDSPVSISVGMN